MSRKKKVLMIITVPFDGYGIGMVVKNYTAQLNKEVDFDFVLCSGGSDENYQYIKDIGSQVVEIPANRLRNPIRYMKSLTNIIIENAYDVVHVHGNSGTMFFDIHAAKKAGIPIRIAHCHNSFCKFRILHYLLKPFLNQEITLGIACSKIAGKWVFSKDFIVMNNAINAEKYSFSELYREQIRTELNVKDRYVILNVGRLVEQKNQEFLLDIMPEIVAKKENTVLILVGDGVLEQKLRERSKELNISNNVFFLGKRNDVERIYSAADCFAFPSLYEGLGLGLVEAQASGLRCVASTNVPQEANVTEKVSYISLENVDEWVELLIKENCKSVNERQQISFDSCKSIKQKNYDIKEEAKKLKKLYTGIVSD